LVNYFILNGLTVIFFTAAFFVAVFLAVFTLEIAFLPTFFIYFDGFIFEADVLAILLNIFGL